MLRSIFIQEVVLKLVNGQQNSGTRKRYIAVLEIHAGYCHHGYRDSESSWARGSLWPRPRHSRLEWAHRAGLLLEEQQVPRLVSLPGLGYSW